MPDLEPILKPTYGVILYQEQVMQIAQVLAGYSLGEPICCAEPWARKTGGDGQAADHIHEGSGGPGRGYRILQPIFST